NRPDIQPHGGPHAIEGLSRGDTVFDKAFADDVHLPLAANHTQIRGGTVNTLLQHNPVVTVSARNDYDVRILIFRKTRDFRWDVPANCANTFGIQFGLHKGRPIVDDRYIK